MNPVAKFLLACDREREMFELMLRGGDGVLQSLHSFHSAATTTESELNKTYRLHEFYDLLPQWWSCLAFARID